MTKVNEFCLGDGNWRLSEMAGHLSDRNFRTFEGNKNRHGTFNREKNPQILSVVHHGEMEVR